MRRGVAAVALLISAGLVLAGCTGIPMSGSVDQGEIINEGVELDVGYDPLGPQPGASQQDILLGFIDAATNPQNDYAVARSFLSNSFRGDWKAEFTQVRTLPGLARQVTDTSMSYTVSTSASVDASGQYSEETLGKQVLDFTFVQDSDGEWRIDSAPNGIVLSEDGFATIFEPHALYFFDPSYRYLVPDVRWFPKTTLQSTRIVRALLAGQAAWLGQGVTNNEFPVGTTLESAVTVVSGVANVDLSEDIVGASIEQRGRMRQQLESTLGSTVLLTVNGVSIDVPDTSVAPATINPAVTNQLLAQGSEGFGFYSAAGARSTLPGQSAEIANLGANAATLASNGESTAVRAADGVHLVFSGPEDSLLLDKRRGLVAPMLDPFGYVWSVPATDATALRVYDSSGAEFSIEHPQFAGSGVIAFALSRDGTRALFLLSSSIGPRLTVAGVLRRDGMPYALGEGHDLPLGENVSPVDVAWVDDDTVAAMADEADSDNSVITLYQIGGPSASFGRVPLGTTIVGGNGTSGLRVLSATGTVYQPRGSGWAETGLTASFLATQQ